MEALAINTIPIAIRRKGIKNERERSDILINLTNKKNTPANMRRRPALRFPAINIIPVIINATGHVNIKLMDLPINNNGAYNKEWLKNCGPNNK